MVFNSAAVVAVADVSTETWQLMWRIPSSQRINTRQLVDMAVCYPMYQLSLLLPPRVTTSTAALHQVATTTTSTTVA
ncbi:hypothetical protein DY000_02059667 [Brassica cretica]|uniref:Secreted protein n=1 Tax=Brassica cretica TaxID=69181 RepID=A0ABQ7AVC6_BRACR|nr:hypothetical protein DY000_02059667 [Brassica cretica]